MEYAGFWIRTAAAIVDTVLLLAVITPVFFFESLNQSQLGLIVNYILPPIAIILFWIYKSATPGKMAIRLSIVDANTGGRPATWQFVVRYFGYYVSMLPLFIGIVWIGIDKRKQGWHDKLARTVVIRTEKGNQQ